MEIRLVFTMLAFHFLCSGLQRFGLLCIEQGVLPRPQLLLVF